MLIGSLLLQPNKVAAPAAPSPAALLEDAIALAVRVFWDRAHGGPCLSLIETALGNSLANLRDGMKNGEAAALQKFQAWAQPLLDRLAALGQSMPADSAAHEALESGDVLAGLIVELLDGVTTDQLAKHLDVVLKILQDDLGLTSTFIDQQVVSICDEIVKQLRGAPPEADLNARSNRFEIIALVKRIRREIDGQFTMPPINVDRLAAPLLDRLRSLNYDAAVARAAAIGTAVKTGLDAMKAISDEAGFSMGFAGGPGAAGTPGGGNQHCWYASWVAGTETWDSDPVHCAALKPYSFKHQDAAAMEKITLHMTWPFTLADGILVSILGYMQGRGAYSITTMSMVRDLTYTLVAPLAGFNLPTLLDAYMNDTVVAGWFDKFYKILVTALCSLEGRALNSYDFFLYVLRFIFRYGSSALPLDLIRDAILSIITLANHDKSISPDPLNRNNGGLTQFFMQLVGPLIHAGVMPDNYFSINGEYGTLVAAVLAGGLGMSVLTFFTGMLLSAAIAGDFPDPGKAAVTWVKGWGLSYLSFIGLWFVFADGSTDGGKRGYTPDGHRGTQVAFNGYPAAATSPYLLPFEGSAECIQGNHGFWSHNSVIGQVFSYDFSLNLGQDVLCMRDGTVSEAPLDSVDDGDHPADGNHLVIKHTPNALDDLDVGGNLVTTYAKYYHGQKGSIAAAFSGSLPAAGTAVTQGQLLMKANSTGMSRCNHVHVQVSPDNGHGAPNGYTIPWVFKDIPDDGVAKSKKVYDSQNVKKP